MAIGEFVEWVVAHPEYRKKGRRPPGYIITENGCHLWQGSRDTNGYSQVRVGGRMQMVYRVRYEREIGPIPEGADLDHIVCDNGAGGCCNPFHCRPVAHRENVLRGDGPTARNRAKTHCKKNHELAGDNLEPYALRHGRRRCWTCHRATQREWKREQKR